MNYRLTKTQLIESAYYCGAGIDLQPILRFGDTISNFIYVTVGISQETFLTGIDQFISKINNDPENSHFSIKKISCENISLEDIEHPRANRLLTAPDYFTSTDFQEYIKVMNQFYNRSDDFYLEIALKLKIADIERDIRLFHLTGEALATYDVLFRRQGIAPKIFISIQTGLIEIPERFSNKMFELSDNTPKIWLRGVSGNSEYFTTRTDVFNITGIYNEMIGEFRNWKVPNLDENSPNRIVKAYGQSSEWNNVESSTIKVNGLTINKILGKYNGNMAAEYNLVKRGFRLSQLSEIVQEAIKHHNVNTENDTIRIAILPSGFESFEIMVNEFARSYTPSSFKLEIDIFYANKIDIKRDF